MSFVPDRELRLTARKLEHATIRAHFVRSQLAVGRREENLVRDTVEHRLARPPQTVRIECQGRIAAAERRVQGSVADAGVGT